MVSAGGCAAITGLDSIQEQSCAPLCDAGATTDSSIDVPTGDDQTAETSGMDQTADSPADTTHDVTGAETAPETGGGDTGGKEGGTDAPPDVTYTDAPFDSGCGNLNTTTNCGACGDKCAAVNTVQTSAQCCSGTTCPGSTNGQGDSCQYTCATGYLDCNVGIPPNSDGCECNVPGATASQCCTDACPIQHKNGLNQASSKFYDCEPTGQYSQNLATDACTAFTGNAAQCTPGQCAAPDGAADGDVVVCATGSPTDCVCWTFAGPNVGYFHDPHAAPGAQQQNCFCADKTLGDTQYN